MRVHVRPPTKTPQEIADYDPPVGSWVEDFYTDDGECWWEGEVRNKKGWFYVIEFPDEDEMVVSDVRLRSE